MRPFRRPFLLVFRLLLAAAVGFSATAAWAERVEDLPQPTDYVSDYAHVLSPEAIARIDRICAQLDHSQANAQIAVVTIHTLGGDDSADFGTRLFHQMKIGPKGTDRGVLLLFAIDDHRRSIKTGYGMEGILPDAKTGDIGRDMVPYLRANDFDGAVTLGVNEVAQVIAADAKVTLD
ncbi:MAG: TPM domain-containing protein, partial [Terracidiphilus sp.]